MRKRAIWLLVLTSLLWSSSGLFVKMISWQPMAILGGRSAIATLVLLVYLRAMPTKITKWQLVGGVAYLLTQLFFIVGTKLAPAANVIFLSYTSPLFLVIFGVWFAGERPQKGDWVTMPIIFLGMILFMGDKLSADAVQGSLLGVLSGVMMAIMALAMRKQKGGMPAFSILIGNIIGAIVGLPFVFSESFALPNVGIILFLGVFQIGLSFILYSYAIKELEALESTLLTTLEPIFNPIWVFLVIGEVPGTWALLGGLIVVGAVALRGVLSAQVGQQV